MAPLLSAGDGGVAKATTPGDLPIAVVMATTSGGDFSATETTAIRHSVAKTAKGFCRSCFQCL